MHTNILQYLEHTAEQKPDKVAFSDGSDDRTFGEVLSSSMSVGSFLCRLGIYGKPIVIMMKKHPDEISAFLGCVYSGNFYVPLDTEMPPKRMELIIASVSPAAVICDTASEKVARSLGIDNANVYLYSDICETPIDKTELDCVRLKQIDTDPIYIVFTSGSTGVPKGVIACHRSVIDYTESLCEALSFDENNIFANQTPLYFDAPLKEIMPTLKYGATTYLVPKKMFMFPTLMLDYLDKYHINTVCWVVSALTQISALGAIDNRSPKYLKTVAFGSEVFPIKQFNIWRRALPNADFYNLYGPTEATGMSCWYKVDREFDEGDVIPVGRPFRNTDIILLCERDDGEGNVKAERAKVGEVGEICMRGTCVTLGYYGNAEKTASAFVQNPLNTVYPETIYKTGDLGRFNERGELIFVSRKDSQIKHMGHRIELGEIEAAASSCPKISRACCVYDADTKRIVIFFSGDADKRELFAYLKDSLPRYMLPSETVKLDTLPLTPNGKLDRRLMGEMAVKLESK